MPVPMQSSVKSPRNKRLKIHADITRWTRSTRARPRREGDCERERERERNCIVHGDANSQLIIIRRMWRKIHAAGRLVRSLSIAFAPIVVGGNRRVKHEREREGEGDFCLK